METERVSRPAKDGWAADLLGFFGIHRMAVTPQSRLEDLSRFDPCLPSGCSMECSPAVA